jgi:hypothetical protein
MEPLKARTTSIIALGLVLTTLISGVVLMKVADSAPQVHCQMHGHTVVCAAAKA